MTFKTNPERSEEEVAKNTAEVAGGGIKFQTDPAFAAAGGLQSDGPLGLTGKVAHVHKQDCEGMLAIDAFTGQVILNADTPEWAKDLGLVSAQLAERHLFYAKRLGPAYAEEHISPEVYAYEDLGWLALVDDGTEANETVYSADDEHRMNVVAQVLGLDRSADASEEANMGGNVLAEMEIASDMTRTQAEADALAEATHKQFEKDQAHG
ncbi:hypothetical protein [Mesorhizobium sp. WSM4982]|uniref:hypothetical protein n=1 Tax=Mesorhizobium sp. WSM4982 TaxID=3038550 RepID=UPI00241513AF|nr:hypothetical protein [Mesorhizobium sp. WSM4982]MDG4856397.1 hypothetical protein [Mesorhizobium sp. WSM4982]